MSSASSSSVSLPSSDSVSLLVPRLGLGCWNFGSVSGDYFGDLSHKDFAGIVRSAVEQGCYYFDTAEVYNAGKSESALGQLLEQLPADLAKKVVIGSKVGPHHCYANTLRDTLQNTLKRLKRAYVDLYMIHWPLEVNSMPHFTSDAALISSPPPLGECLKTLKSLQDEGLIKHIGVSNFGVEQMTEAIKYGIKIEVNELMYNLLARQAETAIFPFCRQHNIQVFAYMPVLQGVLTDKYATDLSQLSNARRRVRHFKSAGNEMSRHGGAGYEVLMQSTLHALQKVAAREKVSLNHLALSWVNSSSYISCTIVGVSDDKQLKENLSALEWKMSDSLREELNEISKPLWEAMGDQLDMYQPKEKNRIH